MYCRYIDPSLIGRRIDANYYAPEALREMEKLIKSGIEISPVSKVCHRRNSGPFGSSLLASSYVPKGIDSIIFFRPVDCKDVIANTYNENVYISRADNLRLSSSSFSAGSLIFTKIGNSIGDVSVVPGYIKQCNISGNMMGMDVDEIDPYFLLAYLKSSNGITQINRGTIGGPMPKIDMESIAEIQVPKPDLEIQRAIGNKLRKAERLRELAQKSQSTISQNIEAIFGRFEKQKQHKTKFWVYTKCLDSYRLNINEYYPHCLAVEKKLLNQFEAVRLIDILKVKRDISGGATPSGAKYTDRGIGFLRVQNVLPNRLDINDIAYIDQNTNKLLKRSIIKVHDIVMTITGYPGTACCVQEDDLPLNINQHSVRFHLKEEWNPFFVAAFINSDWGKAQIERRSIGGTRDALDYPSVLSLVIPKVEKSIQDELGNLSIKYANELKDFKKFISFAKKDIENLIGRNLDMDSLLADSLEIERWLEENPSPNN